MENIEVVAIKTKNNLYCKTGIINEYRRAFLGGFGASVKDLTCHLKKHKHTCCGSRVAWRHKVQCTKFKGNERWQELEREEQKFLKNAEMSQKEQNT